MPLEPNADSTRRTAAGRDYVAMTVPAQIGSVQIEQEIGRGAMGVVYAGRDRMLNRRVAIKFLLDAVSGEDDPEFARFLEGARAAAAVRHEGLVAVHSAGLHERIPYLVMEFVDGPTLGELIRRFGPLEPATALAVIVRICAAVGDLHDRSIIHRDVKPTNVMVDVNGDSFVTDFGLACLRSSQGASVAGTPAYMAPEMFAGVVTPRTDVYAIGVTLFELLTGEVPFGGSIDEIREQQENAALPVQRLKLRGIQPAIIEVVERATHKDAMYRYKNASAMLRAIRAIEPTPSDASTCRSELAMRFTRWRDAAAHPAEADDERGSSYYERLALRAADKRGEKPAPAGAGNEIQNTTPRPIANAMVVAVDIPCIPCGYSLRGLRTDRRCPECGNPVERSLVDFRLVFADNKWLRNVGLGLALLRWGMWSVIFSVVAIILLSVWTSIAREVLTMLGVPMPTSMPATSNAAVPTEVYILAGIMGFALTAPVFLFFIGSFLATQPERISAEVKPWAGPRVSRRIARYVLMVSTIGVFVVNALPKDQQLLPACVLRTLCFLGCAEFLWYIGDLMARVPDPKLRRQMRIVSLFSALGVAPPLLSYAANVRPSLQSYALSAVVIDQAIGLIVFIGSFSLVESMRKAVRAARAANVSRDSLLVSAPATTLTDVANPS